jgi:hypothetical protein
MPFSSLTDPELYHLCKKYGVNTRHWLRKFAGLLPEVSRRGLHKKRGYGSLYEFAGKLAGMSETGVTRVLWIFDRIKDKPKLRNLFETGEVGWSKLEVIANIATKDTDAFWANKVQELTQGPLRAYVHEYRLQSSVNEDSDNMSQTRQPSRRAISMLLALDTAKEFYLLRQHIEKKKKQTLTNNEIMQELMRGYKSESPDNLPEFDRLMVAMN